MVITTAPNREVAERLAESVVVSRFAACVQMADIRSCYIWDGVLQREHEVALSIKTTEASYAKLEAHIREHHPYQTPEIIKVPITGGLPAYLNWLDANTAPASCPEA